MYRAMRTHDSPVACNSFKSFFNRLRAKKLRAIKPSCDTRFHRAFTICICVFNVITLVSANQSNFFEKTTTFRKYTLKTRVATSLKVRKTTFEQGSFDSDDEKEEIFSVNHFARRVSPTLFDVQA